MDTSASSEAGPSTRNLSSINAQLISHGWIKKPLNLDRLSETDHTAVITALFDLLGSSTSNLNNFDDLAARHRSLTYEHERLTRQQSQNRSAASRLEAEVLGWKARCTETEKRFAAEEAKVKELREEVSRGRKALEGVRVAAGHEAKKNQIKLDKANAQLLKLSNDTSLATRPQGLILLNPISGGRSYPVAPQQPILLEQSVKDLGEIRQSLQEETEAFRHVVVSTANALREALAAREGKDESPRLLHSQFFSVASNDPLSKRILNQAASSTAHPTIADAKLKSLISEARKKLTEGVVKRVIDVTGSAAAEEEDIEERKRIEREQERIRTELEEKVKDLEVEVTCVRAREEEAQRLVDEMARQQAQERVGRKDEEEIVLDEAEYQTLRDQQRKLERERKAFAEATARLDHRRLQLDAEQAEFRAERKRIEDAAVLALLPTTPSSTSADPVPIWSSSEGSTSPEGSPAGPSSPGKHLHPQHRPSSPSPLSPSHKLRTPRPASVGKKRVKTPLSRLVLEKAVRQKGRDTATALELERLSGSVLGEGGRRGNEVRPKARSSGLKGSTLANGHKKISPLGNSIIGQSTLKSGASLGVSARGGSNDGASGSGELRRSVIGRDLSKADGIGPRGSMKPKVWR